MEGVRRLRNSDGFTLLEMLVVAAIVAVLAGAAIVGSRQAKIRAGEASTVSTLRSLNQAQFVYMQSCGKQRYAPTLVTLGSPAPGDEHGFVSADLAVSDPLAKSGYIVQMTGTSATPENPLGTSSACARSRVIAAKAPGKSPGAGTSWSWRPRRAASVCT